VEHGDFLLLLRRNDLLGHGFHLSRARRSGFRPKRFEQRKLLAHSARPKTNDGGSQGGHPNQRCRVEAR
jgi:hypothetical protein